MIVGSIKEDVNLEKRVSVTPETAKNIIALGLSVNLEKNYAIHLGVSDKQYEDTGVKFYNNSKEVIDNSNLILKVNYPTEDEIKTIKEKTILVGIFNPSKNREKFKELLKKKSISFHLNFYLVFQELNRWMFSLHSLT